VLLARWDSRPAGFVIVRIAPLTLLGETPAVHVEQLFVTPELRRHGIARALLGGRRRPRRAECADQVVAGVPPWARDTHRFFARLGFTPFVVRRTVATGVLRRRLAGESTRGAVDDLLSRRRSLARRARLLHRRDSAAAFADRRGRPAHRSRRDQPRCSRTRARGGRDEPGAVDTATIDAAAIAAAALDAAALDEVAYDHR
jgi:GNAT superfamily N-acetyltransferase